MSNQKHSALLAISAAALSLPALTPEPAHAVSASDDKTLSYRYSQYDEEALPTGSLAEGDETRYSIEVHQFRFKSPAFKRAEISLDLLSESMSGASPWYIVPDAEGNPVQVMSGATIEEQRVDIDVSFKHYFDSSQLAMSVSNSSENDYESVSFGMSYALDFNNNNTTLDFGISHSDDSITPSDVDDYPLRPEEEQKTSSSALIGLTQVLSKTLLFNTSFSYAVYDGFLSDPYKQAFVNGQIVADSRPDQRQQYAWTTQLRSFVNKANAALHLDYRYYSNDWGVESHTVETSWYQNIGGHVKLVPEVRWYSQSSANFYRHYYQLPRADSYYSSDYRLSNFSAISGRIKLMMFFKHINLHLSLEDYVSIDNDEPNSLTKGNPALIDFSHLTFGLDYKF